MIASYRLLPRRTCTKIITLPRISLRMASAVASGDLNNIAASRARAEISTDPAYHGASLAISASQDDALIRKSYRPFLLDGLQSSQDWISQLELSTVLKMVDTQVLKNDGDRLKVLVLHGSMRTR